MDAKDLMIDDWVQVPCLIDNVEHYDAWCKVKQLRDCDLDVIGFKELKYNEIMPIPLTAEILKKYGFHESILQNDRWIYQDIALTKVGDSYILSSLYDDFNIGIRPRICAVHELQHALRLCGIEKEIIV